MRFLTPALCTAILCLIVQLDTRGANRTGTQELAAPTYYIVARVDDCWADEISVHGASNLPQGSFIGINVSDFDGDGWKYYTPQVFVQLDSQGYFDAKIHPLPKLSFKRNLLAGVFFSPGYHKQPERVLSAVGSHGQNLDERRNPQAYHMPGDYSYLETIARVGACTSLRISDNEK